MRRKNIHQRSLLSKADTAVPLYRHSDIRGFYIARRRTVLTSAPEQGEDRVLPDFHSLVHTQLLTAVAAYAAVNVDARFSFFAVGDKLDSLLRAGARAFAAADADFIVNFGSRTYPFVYPAAAQPRQHDNRRRMLLPRLNRVGQPEALGAEVLVYSVAQL